MWNTISCIPSGICWFLASAALALSVASAEETTRQDKDAVVRQVDLNGFTRARTRGVATKPTKIANAEELAMAFPDSDEEWLARIAKQVDFEKDELLFFAWTGSSTDRLSFKVEETKKGPVVVFSYREGMGDDIPRARFRLYAVARNWRIERAK